MTRGWQSKCIRSSLSFAPLPATQQLLLSAHQHAS
jgi:hypothetical protein